MQYGLLTGAELESCLKKGEIFELNSCDSTMMRHSAYDLRVARDLCIVPRTNSQGQRLHERFDTGQEGPLSFDLLPGESAFVSTQERIHLPWDITARVGTKFSVAAQGLLILTGSIVDPGFGLTQSLDGTWQNSKDERLHFVIANVGPYPIAIEACSKGVASIQFTRVPEVPTEKRKRVVSEGFDAIKRSYLGDSSAQPVLAYFRQISDLRQEVEVIKSQGDLYARRAESAIQGVNTVVLFGIYLVAVTILGVVFATFVSGAAELLGSESAAARWAGVGSLLLVVVCLVLLTSSIIFIIRRKG